MPCLNLKVEMVRRKITIEEIALFLNIHRNSASNKVNGDTSFTFEESVKIQEKYFPDMELKYLFRKTPETDASKTEPA